MIRLNFICAIFLLLFLKTWCILYSRNVYDTLSGCGPVGRALDLGSRCREFESPHSDQIRTIIMIPCVSRLSSLFYALIPTFRCNSNIFKAKTAYPGYSRAGGLLFLGVAWEVLWYCYRFTYVAIVLLMGLSCCLWGYRVTVDCRRKEPTLRRTP